MSQRCRLSVLKMRKTRHYCGRMLLCAGDQRLTQLKQGGQRVDEEFTGPHAKTGRNLVISAPAKMHPPARIRTRISHELSFDPGMDILAGHIEYIGRKTVFHIAQQRREQFFCRYCIDQILFSKHQDMRDINPDIAVRYLSVSFH